MLSKFKVIIRKILVEMLWFFPKKTAHKILYFLQMKRRLNLNEPKDFNEKIQWLIVNEYGKEEGILADKFLVRDYVKNKGYESILVKLIGVYHDSSEINFETLPNQFVLKTNNGCGDVIICKNKNNLNKDLVMKKLNKSLKRNYSKNSLEYHYQFIEPLIICEELLDDGVHFQPEDYKFYCFNGKVDCIMLCSNRERELKLDYYDKNWNHMNYSLEKYESGIKHKKPNNLNNMIKIAEKLSEDFKFVRVDLYEINNKIYFGELTFTPASGLVYYNTKYALERFGKLIKLHK